MVEYECKRCKKIFDKKSNYEKHINRKTKCEIVKRQINDKILELSEENKKIKIENEKLKMEKDRDKYEELAKENEKLKMKKDRDKYEELAKENEKLKMDKDRDKYEELKKENSKLIEQNINLQTEQKNIIKRLNIIENLIVKNTGINIDDENIDNELQTGEAIEGLQFENKLF
jgi:regulator of replication initiation timing